MYSFFKLCDLNDFYIIILRYYAHNKCLRNLNVFSNGRRTKVLMKFSMLLGWNTQKKLNIEESLDPILCSNILGCIYD